MFKFSSFPLSAALVRTLLAVFLLALRLPAVAQAPAWQSARVVAIATAAAAGNFSVVTATAVDAVGNVYLAGVFTNSVVLGGTTLTSLGGNDVFVAKFNPASNQFVWAQQAGGTSFEEASTLVVSGTSVYVAGYFASTSASFGATTLTNAGNAGITDVFVAKLSDAGSFIWAQRAGGTDDDRASALAVSGTSVYMTGKFGGPTASFGATTLTSAGTDDVFVTKLSDTGSFIWAQRAGGARTDGANALAVSGTSVYVAGNFGSSTASFGSATLANAGNTGAEDVFVAKLTDAGSTGSFIWAQRAGGIGRDRASALAVSGTSIYVTGYFDSLTASFGPAILANAGVEDVFVAKLTDAGSTGNFIWAQRAGGTGADRARVLAVGGTSVYVAGEFFSSTAGFGATILTNADNAGTPDVFMTKLSDTGSFTWAQRAGDTGGDFVQGMVVSGTNVYVAGYFACCLSNFGNITLNSANSGSYLGFLASLTDPTLTATTPGHMLAPAQLFPNPAHRTATLRLPAGTAPAPLTLTDALGRAVRRYPAPAGPEAALDLQGLPAGLYLLRGAGLAQRLAVE